MKGAICEDTGKVMQELRTASGGGEDMLKATAGDPGEKASQCRAKLEAAAEKAKALYGQLADKAGSGAKAADKAVREHPYQALGIAFGVGLLIGVLAARRNRE